MTEEEAHARARERGSSKFLYAFIRALLMPIAKLWFRMKVTGAPE